MHRRRIIAAAACCAALRVRTQQPEPRPRQKISAARLYEALDSRFPVRFGMPPLLELQVSAPRLNLQPARNRLGATLVAQASGLQLRELQAGEMDVFFALRYEASDRTLRAHRAEIDELRWPGLPPELLRRLRELLPALTREAMGEVVLHRFTDAELALPDTMGFEPGPLTVLEDGLLIEFLPKARR
jgi:hypothetical protein